MAIAALDLDLEVFHGPFDLLLTLVLNEEIDLLEVDLGVGTTGDTTRDGPAGLV